VEILNFFVTRKNNVEIPHFFKTRVPVVTRVSLFLQIYTKARSECLCFNPDGHD